MLQDKQLPSSDLEHEIEEQKYMHVLKMLRAQLMRNLQNDHEQEEIPSALRSYKKILSTRARLVADTRFSQWNLKNVSDAVKANQEKDEVIDASWRLNETPFAMADFMYRLFSYALAASAIAVLAFLMIGK